MRFVCMWVLVSVVLGLRAVAAQMPPPQASTPVFHRSACSLGESMASKLGNKNITPDAAERACKQLAPEMKDKDHAEFMRCCTAKLKP